MLNKSQFVPLNRLDLALRELGSYASLAMKLDVLEKVPVGFPDLKAFLWE